MQHAQFRVAELGKMAQAVVALLVLVLVLMPVPARPAAITHPPHPDPLLDGRVDGPCAAALAGPDYAAGVDSEGHPVVPPDVGVPPIAIPDQVVVPLPGAGRGRRGGESGYAAIDGRRLEPLVNPGRCEPPR
jgi:hypothetical protein